ncbi:MAG: hypothetical protein ACRD4R_12690 [Candidatus Acidiferrales bacterium]
MPDWRPDWRKEASRKVANSKLSAGDREEVSHELADYLEDLCGDAPSRGLDDRAAAQHAAAELHEDRHLGAHLYRARKGNPMNLNDRTKRLWLPGIVMLFAAAATLAASQVAGSWVYHAFTPTPVMGSLSVHATSYPELIRNLMRHNSAALTIYLAWVYTLPFLGALGAYCSRRARSSRAMQIVSGLFPMILFLAIFIGQRNVARQGTSLPFLAMDALPPAHMFFLFLSASSNLLLSWVVIPGAALLLGVLPFLWLDESHRQAHPSALRQSTD